MAEQTSQRQTGAVMAMVLFCCFIGNGSVDSSLTTPTPETPHGIRFNTTKVPAILKSKLAADFTYWMR
jgi:hypothetical protein